MGRPSVPLQVVTRRLQEDHLLLELRGPDSPALSGVAQDSRQVKPGDLFLAWQGVEHDAHAFLPQAVEAGAVAAVVERLDPRLSVSQLLVRDGRRAGALAADAVLGSPWVLLFLAGVTGTNGKTTTAALARHLLQGQGAARAVGTLGVLEETGAVRAGTEGLTTPGPVQISYWIREMADQGVTHGVIEASSHALAQYRLDGLRFDAAVFTNLGRDHLDYHADLAEYRDAKARLAGLLKPDGWVVVNRNESAWDGLPFPEGRTLSVGIPPGHQAPGRVEGWGEFQLLAWEMELLPQGARFLLSDGEVGAPVQLPLLGRFNVENAMAAAGVARVGGMSVEEIAQGLSAAPQVPGRLERLVTEPFTVLIDFAHTPDALERVLGTLRPLVAGRLMVLFGAGGDRDRGKRPRMGTVVAGLADLAFVTSDNPRTEDPDAIIDDVVAGMVGARFRRIPDRREAIAAALREAAPGDLLLLAGKGHETYQVVGTERQPFDERFIVRELLVQGEGGVGG